jgi:FemAB-related protein (PEP-CTERM system-associated)
VNLQIGRLEGGPSEWDSFVRLQADWTHFHLAGWMPVMQSALGHECIYLTARDDSDGIVGVLPLVRVKSVVFGHFLVSMPFLNYGGPLGDDASVKQLTETAVELADRDSVKLLQLRSRFPLPLSLPVSHHKVTTLLDLPDDADQLWSSFPSKLRTKIRRPEKDGVEMRFGADQVEPFYGVFAHHMRDLGTPTHALRLFESIRDQFADSIIVGCAYYRDRPIACGFGFCWEREFEMTWSCALREFRTLRANMLLYWSFMRETVTRGINLFNFGRSTPQSGTHGFKQQWGSRDEALNWYYHSRSGEQAAPSPDDSAFSWGPRMWQRLPRTVANALGPRIVRYIP